MNGDHPLWGPMLLQAAKLLNRRVKSLNGDVHVSGEGVDLAFRFKVVVGRKNSFWLPRERKPDCDLMSKEELEAAILVLNLSFWSVAAYADGGWGLEVDLGKPVRVVKLEKPHIRISMIKPAPNPLRVIDLGEYLEMAKAQGVPREHVAFKCPMCGVVQSMTCLIKAGAGASVSEVERYAGFSCVGRWTGAGEPRAHPDGRPCNWTLGGLIQVHRLEVRLPNRRVQKTFELATPEEAQSLMKRNNGEVL